MSFDNTMRAMTRLSLCCALLGAAACNREQAPPPEYPPIEEPTAPETAASTDIEAYLEHLSRSGFAVSRTPVCFEGSTQTSTLPSWVLDCRR